MGRGRAKAKQTKVARELKYRTFETDLEALQRELAARNSGNGQEPSSDDVEREGDDYDDDYADRR